jgi:hypothetical protein
MGFVLDYFLVISLRTSVFNCQFHSTNAQYSFVRHCHHTVLAKGAVFTEHTLQCTGMIGIGKETFLSRNLFIIQTTRLQHFRRIISKCFTTWCISMWAHLVARIISRRYSASLHEFLEHVLFTVFTVSHVRAFSCWRLSLLTFM